MEQRVAPSEIRISHVALRFAPLMRATALSVTSS